MCHARYDSYTHDSGEPRPRAVVTRPYDVRASDAEREAVVDALRTHAGAGRLDPEELEARIGRAYAAQRRADLAPLVADLPELTAAAPRPRRVRDARLASELRKVAAVAVLLVAIWALSGAGYFWPAWPLVVMAFGLAHGGGRGRHGGRRTRRPVNRLEIRPRRL
jgi:hypothetical protein